jgi:hypothetical protein
MSDAIRDLNLKLLISLKQHLDQTDQLRRLMDDLLRLSRTAAEQEQAPPRPREVRHVQR